MSYTRNNFHLKLALHLADHELFVKSIRPRENQQSGRATRKEA
jgi:hypothetical protein